MKREKVPASNNYQIKCSCGNVFNARGDNVTIIAGNPEWYTPERLNSYQWTCPSCGQVYSETIRQIIELDPIN